MSRQEPEPTARSRPRANTTALSFSWRRPSRNEQAVAHPPTPPVAALSLEALIKLLSPPAVPSPTHSRSLVSALASCSPLPRLEILNPILGSLCNVDAPSSVQAAGYDIITAYYSHAEAPALSTAERLTYFSIFLGSTPAWSVELWEPRFKAIHAFVNRGADGIENKVVEVLEKWIEGAFEGLLRASSSSERPEGPERERSLDQLCSFLEETLEKNISRIGNSEVLYFYASLVDRAITYQPFPHNKEPTPQPSSPTSPLTRHPSASHRRNLSSMSTSHSISAILAPAALKHPTELATTLYLRHLSAQLKTMDAVHFNSIIPLLFRALAFCSTPLTRVTPEALRAKQKEETVEDKIIQTLVELFAGKYATSCLLVHKFYLFPPGRSPESITALSGSAKTDHRLPNPVVALLTSLGAMRMLRINIRRAIGIHLLRAEIGGRVADSYSHSGAPGHMDINNDLLERAWPKEDPFAASGGIGGPGWDTQRLGMTLAASVESWIDFHFDDASLPTHTARMAFQETEHRGQEDILEEVSGILKDILNELDTMVEERTVLDEEEATAVALTLLKLSSYVFRHKNPDGSPFIIPLNNPQSAPTPILRTIASLLSRDHSQALNPMLAGVLISVADHLTDDDTVRLPQLMTEQHDLVPISPGWLTNWESLLANDTLMSTQRPQTRRTIMSTFKEVYESVKDMVRYRRPLGDLVRKFCSGMMGTNDNTDDADIMWKLLGEEVVLRSDERGEKDIVDLKEVMSFIDLFVTMASSKSEDGSENNDASSVYTNETHSPTPAVTPMPSGPVSPTLSRGQTEYHSREKDKDSSMPSVMSILSSLTTGAGQSRAQSVPPHAIAEDDNSEEPTVAETSVPPPPRRPPVPREVSAVSALVEIFSQLVFTPLSLRPQNLLLAIEVYKRLLPVVNNGQSTAARLAALQFLMRFRADRDHNLYFVTDTYDPNGLIFSLGSLINRVEGHHSGARTGSEDANGEGADIRRPRTQPMQERDGRMMARGRGLAGGLPRSAVSRSRSRTTRPAPALPPPKPLESLWRIPEAFPFHVYGPDSPSEVLVSYDHLGPDRILVLPISSYLLVIDGILEKETSWEILSYVLCHLPVQLANKHLFCGPKSRAAISRMMTIICSGIISGSMTTSIEQWPTGLKARDANGLAYHTLSVLVSYRRGFDLQQRHHLVEVFYHGLDGAPPTIKCCLHALTLSAFELQPSTTKWLSRILEKLSQIMSNPSMAVHILGFIAIVGSLRDLHANFTEADFKMVFAVALQFLQHYNQQRAPSSMSWALAQHVRILSYSTVYVWFLAVKLPDRPRHIRYISRQLLLANEDNPDVDDPTEVCFDWLARYTYGSADPRPTTSTFSDIIMNPSNKTAELSEKTWIAGNSVITIRALMRSGWVEVMSRRPSGFSRFMCRIENVPMVGPGDVAPDLMSVPAGLLLERDLLHPEADPERPPLNGEVNQDQMHVLSQMDIPETDNLPQPDPITGYVWSGTAPSQRRKHVSIDPAFLILQLSPFPDGRTVPFTKRIADPQVVNKFVTGLDRIPVIDTHKVGIMYVAPGQTHEVDILRNVHGSPAYTRFLEGMGRLINLRGQLDVYAGGLDPDEDGEYAYAWWDDIGQILFHTATMMPTTEDDPHCNNKKRHIGNDYVRIIWNDSALPYQFDTLKTQFQFVNIVIEPHSVGAIAAFSNNLHENEYFKVTIQSAPGMTEFAPIGFFKLISADNLPLLIRQLCLLADWFASIFSATKHDTVQVEMKTNWHARLEAIRRFKNQVPPDEASSDVVEGIMGQEALRDFTTSF